MRQTETILYEQLAQYMNLNYPGVLYHFDLSGVNNPSPRSRALYSRLNGRGFPDMFIYALGSYADRTYYGLALELKRAGERIKKRNGEWADEHVAEQWQYIQRLRQSGYVADIVVGFDDAREAIDSYLKYAIINTPAEEAVF